MTAREPTGSSSEASHWPARPSLAARRLLSWAPAAGLTTVTATSSTWCYATPEARDGWGGMWADQILESALARQLVNDGYSTTDDLRRISAAWRTWAAADNGGMPLLHGETLGDYPVVPDNHAWLET